jgi:hypothetical protein
MRTGYNGQRYEVRYRDGSGGWHVFGWCNEADGGALVESIKLNPSMYGSKVIDLQAGNVAPAAKESKKE